MESFKLFLEEKGFKYITLDCNCNNKWELDQVDAVVRVNRYSDCYGAGERDLKCPPEIEAYRNGELLFEMKGIPNLEEFEQKLTQNGF